MVMPDSRDCIGLSIAKRLIRLNGFNFYLESLLTNASLARSTTINPIQLGYHLQEQC